MEILSSIRDLLLKVPTSLIASLWIILMLSLLAPEKLIEPLGMVELRDEYRHFLGPASLLLLAVLFSRALSWVANTIRIRKTKKLSINSLHELTAEEKGYLYCFVIEGLTSIYVSTSDGIAGGLQAKAIIFRQSDIVDLMKGVPYGIQPWASRYLSLNPDLLSGATGRPRSPKEKLGFR